MTYSAGIYSTLNQQMSAYRKERNTENTESKHLRYKMAKKQAEDRNMDVSAQRIASMLERVSTAVEEHNESSEPPEFHLKNTIPQKRGHSVVSILLRHIRNGTLGQLWKVASTQSVETDSEKKVQHVMNDQKIKEYANADVTELLEGKITPEAMVDRMMTRVAPAVPSSKAFGRVLSRADEIVKLSDSVISNANDALTEMTKFDLSEEKGTVPESAVEEGKKKLRSLSGHLNLPAFDDDVLQDIMDEESNENISHQLTPRTPKVMSLERAIQRSTPITFIPEKTYADIQDDNPRKPHKLQKKDTGGRHVDIFHGVHLYFVPTLLNKKKISTYTVIKREGTKYNPLTSIEQTALSKVADKLVI